jgi:hypothetical protein
MRSLLVPEVSARMGVAARTVADGFGAAAMGQALVALYRQLTSL